MTPDPLSVTGPFFSSYIALQIRFRRVARFLQTSMDPVEALSKNGPIGTNGVNPYGNTQPDLFGGLEKGFSNVMVELSEIKETMQMLPQTTASVLFKQLQQGVELKAGNGNQLGAIDHMMVVNQQEKAELEVQLHSVNQALVASVAREHDLKTEIFGLKRDITLMEKKEIQFRDIIISNAATQQVTDQEVMQLFSNLRQAVQQVALDLVFDLKQKPHFVETKLSQHQFYTSVRNLSPKDIGSRVRMRTWEIVYRDILHPTIFGLIPREKNDDEAIKKSDIEKHLVLLETYFKKSKVVSDNMMADWKISTLQCIEAMKVREDYNKNVADTMYNFFEPLISKTATDPQKYGLWSKMANVCTKAIALKMVMQRSKEGYNIQTISLKEQPLYSSVTHCAESMGVEDGKTSDASDDIAYVLFGVLMKHPIDNARDSKVLVKAEVILKSLRR